MVRFKLIVLYCCAFALLHVQLCLALITEADKAIFKETYRRVINCLKTGRVGRKEAFNWRNVRFPDDAEEHYSSLLNQTLKFRNGIRPHSYTGYSGKWLENYFIEDYSFRPLHAFGGLIPIFAQWTDIHVHTLMNDGGMSHLPNDTFSTLHKHVRAMLRPDVLYVAVSQDDQGLFQLSKHVPNLLSLSAGGYGNVALPLIKDELAYQEFPNPILGNLSFNWVSTVGFYGGAWQFGTVRPFLIRDFTKLLAKKGVQLKHMKARPDWQNLIAHTKFNLAPRGFGRTSFRLAEIIQIGRIPIYLYSDVPWIPYPGTNISMENFAYLANKIT